MNEKYKLPAILGGNPEFSKKIPITKPTLPSFDKIAPLLEETIKSGMITNATHVRSFEEGLKKYLGVKHVFAVSSCTSGLMLLFKSLGLKGEVILPSFTFSATGHALLWNNLKPIFVDVDPKTYNLDPLKVEEAITDDTSAILGVHLFGNPADIEKLEAIAKNSGIRLFFDTAHGFGSKYKGQPLGNFGDAEVFSMSPTKLLTAAEGGIIATNDEKIAYAVRIGRNYADPGDYNTQFEGLSARLSEFNAILGLKSLTMLDENVEKRQKIANLYIKGLKDIPGLFFQDIKADNRSSYKDFSVFVDSGEFELNRDQLVMVLEKENIITKKYFHPPLHKQKAFSQYFKEFDAKLSNTNKLSECSISLPLFSHMELEDVLRISKVIKNVYDNRDKIKSLIMQESRV